MRSWIEDCNDWEDEERRELRGGRIEKNIDGKLYYDDYYYNDGNYYYDDD